MATPSFSKDDSDGSSYTVEDKIKLGKGDTIKESARMVARLKPSMKSAILKKGRGATARLLDKEKSAKLK